MSIDRRAGAGGFTMVEVLTAAVLAVTVIAASLMGFLFFLKAHLKSDAQNELDVEVVRACEQLKTDVRLSALDEMCFHPVDGSVFTAFSFPLARDDDGDGVVDTDAGGRIIWDRTIVYHVWESSPNELRVTTFDPRDESLGDADRQAQLESVVARGSGRYAPNGANASTRTLFSNLFEWEIVPRGAEYDAYADEVCRDVNVTLGSCVIGPGNHDFTFRVLGKDARSTGFAIGIDSLFVSGCGASREAEMQLPVRSMSGSFIGASRMDGGSWNGNYQLYFNADDVGDFFVLGMSNDRWEESLFLGEGHSHESTVIEFDESVSPADYVVRLEGDDEAWVAADQCGNVEGFSPLSDETRGLVVRVLVRGEEMEDGGWIKCGGSQCRIVLRAGDSIGQELAVEQAFIGECASRTTPSMDVRAGTTVPVTFDGDTSVRIGRGLTTWSDLLPMPIDRTSSYLVTYEVKDAAGLGTAWKWGRNDGKSTVGSYIVASATNDTITARAEMWSSRGDVVRTNCVYGLESVWATHVPSGVYVSRILDTGHDSPHYTSVTWQSVQPEGSGLGVSIRTGQQEDLQDAPAWSAVPPMYMPGTVSGVGNGRYIQFRLDLRATSGGIETPKVKSVAIDWAGEEQDVDVGGTFTKGPDYGRFEVLVDGRRPRRGLFVQLELFRDIRGFKRTGDHRITSWCGIEILPRNTGL